ncbi:MAG TPA: tRNA (pseudouridine(54)-N(1))-methyltransferase TrmY [Thermoplasmata archaeon]|nr:tRNA (pseudouridine(54)-N(1))-methyltransferase TrmY [Thermoplasmata archaeon]
MRRILLLAHRVPVDGAFTLNDLAGGGGRMDEVARAVSTAFTLSNDLRRDVEMWVLFVAAPAPRARRIRLVGDRLRRLNPDERSTAALLKNALVRSVALDRDVESSPGLVVGPVDPLAALKEFLAGPHPLWLEEGGGPIAAALPGATDFSAVLSDPTDPAPAERAVLESAGVPRVSVGPRALRASQCIDLLLAEFDRREPPIGPAGRPTPEGPARADGPDRGPPASTGT